MKTISIFLTVLCSLFSFAQWNPDVTENLQVSSLNASGNLIAKTSDGKTYIFFLEENATAHYVPRVQLLDQDGNKLFGEDGVVVNSAATFSSSWNLFDCAVDEDNNLIVSFYGSQDKNLYANKISPEGVNLWGDGIFVASGGLLQKIVPLSSGVVIGYHVLGKTYISKYDKDTGASLWENPIIFTSPEPSLSYTSVVEFTKLADDSFISIFSARSTSYGISGTLFAQRYDSDGNPQWTEPLRMTSATAVQCNVRYNRILDGDYLYFPYSTSGITSNTKFDAYIQKIGVDGHLVWGLNGKDISTGTYMEKLPTIAIDGNNIWSLSTFTDTTQSQIGEYVQAFDKNSGEGLLGTEPKEVYPLSNGTAARIHISNLQILNNKPIFITYNHSLSSNNPINIGIVILDSNGNISLDENISDASIKNNINFIVNNDQGIAVWADKRDPDVKIYAQNYKPSETLSSNDEIKNLQYSVYPNPVSTNLSIQTSGKIKESTIYDISGKQILKSSSKDVNMSSLQSGVYVIKTIFQDGKSLSQKVIKK